MGYYIELRTHADVAISREVLITRLKGNHIPEHPERENSYLLKCGILMPHKDKLIEQGNLASIHISGESDLDEWMSLFNQIEKLGCRLYDPATKRFITKNSFEISYEMHQRTINKNVVPNEVLEQKRMDSRVEFLSVADRFAKILYEAKKSANKEGDPSPKK